MASVFIVANRLHSPNDRLPACRSDETFSPWRPPWRSSSRSARRMRRRPQSPNPRRNSRRSSTATSVRPPADASRARPACRAIRSSTTRPPRPAACGSRRDGGMTWKSIFDDQPISSIGSIAVAPSDPNVVYVGSGEANIRGNVAAGNGIYKIDRRRQDLDARLEAGGADRHDGRAPEERGHRLRGGARPCVRPQPGARRLPHARRRQDLAAGPEEGRRHRRVRRRDRSRRTRTSSSPASGRRAGARGR